MTSRTSYLVFAAAELMYIVAVAGRSSFGVAGLYALDRFQIDAATLSLFTVIQLGVYAGAQIPVGYLLDRIGVRRVLVGGALIMAAGQLLLALSSALAWALTARIFIGLGDATAFTSVLRLLPAWFAPRRIPLMTQLTGMIGQLGQVISSIPFAFTLAHLGWSPAFTSLAIMGTASAVCGFFLVRNSPQVSQNPHLAALLVSDDSAVSTSFSSASSSQIREAEGVEDVPRISAFVPSLPMTTKEAVSHPGTWLGFWTHFTCGFPQMVVLLLWGTPFFEVAQGMSAKSAAALLILLPVVGIGFGPLVARFTSRHPVRRSWLVLASVVWTVIAWIPFLAWPGERPFWMLIHLCCALSFTGICSTIAFDFVRTSVHVDRLGTANGLSNAGGFCACLCASFLIGLILDWRSPEGVYSAADFRLALASQILILFVGVLGILISRMRLRARIERAGFTVPPLREVIARYRAHEGKISLS